MKNLARGLMVYFRLTPQEVERFEKLKRSTPAGSVVKNNALAKSLALRGMESLESQEVKQDNTQ